ncbi:SOS response-associated peptidase [Specibacter sp. RAF43]|uniref:SOS response-associated peptidase n=1 Tax=Specibacter sp. RAF43 TaxID=3233057 RepID=UPI003F9433C4
MCGRFVMPRAGADLVSIYNAAGATGPEVRPSWNVAPTQRISIVTERLIPGADEPRRMIETSRWGLVPVWAKDTKGAARLINARSETVTEKPSFRSAASKRRGLVPAAGYYEWQVTPEGKIPTYLHPEDADELLSFAGLYEFWPDPELPEDQEDKWRMTVTIITRAAPDALGHIHDRTPVIVPADLHDEWLDPELTDKSDLRTLIDSIPDPHLVPTVVGTAVGNIRNNGPELIEPV